MPRPRRKQFNAINAPALARWIVITVFLAITGVIYVSLSVQLYRLGDHKKALENELVSLRAQNEAAGVQIATLTSRSALQRQLKEGHLKMIPIAEANIVRINSPRNVAREDALQPVANRSVGR
jgi:hypothetical protein